MSLPRFIQIDEDGYFVSQGLRVEDVALGQSTLQSLASDGQGNFVVNFGGTSALVEAFDEPLVVRHIQRSEKGPWLAQLPYETERHFELDSLRLDDWDRVHGRTTEGLPFVFSRTAQAEFFDAVDELEDDAFWFNKKRYVTSFWLDERSDIGASGFWEGVYQENAQPPWDLEGPSPALPSVLSQLKIPRSRVLVLGSGRGHDAAFFAGQGHVVTAVDYSPTAIAQARERYSSLTQLTFLEADVFQLPTHLRGQFDLIFEHTCYCAIPPQRRSELVKVWRQMLTAEGHLLGVFFAMDRPNGPPYGGSEWELRERLKKNFQFLYWTRWHHSKPARQGKELVIYAQKKEV